MVQRPIAPEDRLVVALDTGDVEQARRLARQLPGVGVLKIGMGLYFQPDASRLVDELIGAGRRVFLDAKAYDIGETVRRAVRSAAARGIAMMTVHAEPGVLDAAVEGRGTASLVLLGVTVLTSLDAAALAALGYAEPLPELIDRRVRAVARSGADGFIASASDHPDQVRRRTGAHHLLAVTPGIRPAGSPAGDQMRTATPKQAVMNGADYLVVGRPITAAPDPAAAARAIIDEISATSGGA